MIRKDAAFAVQDALASLESVDFSHFPGLYDAIPWAALEAVAAEARALADTPER